MHQKRKKYTYFVKNIYTECIKIDGVINMIPMTSVSINKAWIEINSMRDYISTNKIVQLTVYTRFW